MRSQGICKPLRHSHPLRDANADCRCQGAFGPQNALLAPGCPSNASCLIDAIPPHHPHKHARPVVGPTASSNESKISWFSSCALLMFYCSEIDWRMGSSARITGNLRSMIDARHQVLNVLSCRCVAREQAAAKARP